jgi:hypothetical protein
MMQTSFKNLWICICSMIFAVNLSDCTPYLLQPGHFNGHTYDIVSAFQVSKQLRCFDIVTSDLFCDRFQCSFI